MRVRQNGLQPRVIGQIGSDDGGVEFACQQHVDHRASGRGPDDAARVGELCQVPVLKCYPLHRSQIHSEVIAQDAAYPGHRGLGMGAHADALALQLGYRDPRALGVVDQAMVLKAARPDDGGNQRKRFSIGFGLQKGDQREFGDVKLQVAHHPLEGPVGHLHLVEIKVEQLRVDSATPERTGVGIVAQQGLEPWLLGVHGALSAGDQPTRAPARRAG